MSDAANPTEPDDPEVALRKAREIFISTFDEVCDSVMQAGPEDADAMDACRQRVHRLAGLAGIVGFPRVSELALDLETALGRQGPQADTVSAIVADLRRAFAEDLSGPPPPWL